MSCLQCNNKCRACDSKAFAMTAVVSTTPKAKLKVGYVDGCFDMMHSGHYNAVRQAKSLCDRLVVGIHSDACIKANKGPPVMSQEERYSLLQHMKWADKIAFDVPYSPSCALLDKVGADFCVSPHSITVHNLVIAHFIFVSSHFAITMDIDRRYMVTTCRSRAMVPVHTTKSSPQGACE